MNEALSVLCTKLTDNINYFNSNYSISQVQIKLFHERYTDDDLGKNRETAI